MPLPARIVIPLRQHQGEAYKPLVKIGDKVLTGQKIGDSDNVLSSPVHASISGEVTDFITLIEPKTGQTEQAIVIASDGKDEWIKLPAPAEPQSLSHEETLKRIREAGVVGLGGAVFPSHAKLSPPGGKKIDTVILNGCECEPCLSGDHRVMLEHGREVLSGLDIIRNLVSPDKVYIAIEDDKADAIENIRKLISEMKLDFEVVSLKSRYPAGAERLLVQALLGKEIPIRGIPPDIAVIVQNVSTARAIHDAVTEGKPLIEQVVTVTGAVKEPKNLLVRLGTPARDIIDYCGGMTADAPEVVLGGPMTGFSIADLDCPITKGIRCVLVKETAPVKELACIRCGRCLDACPMRLEPTMLARYARAGLYEDCRRLYIDQCFECGSCAFVCPAGIPITQYIKIARRELGRRASPR